MNARVTCVSCGQAYEIPAGVLSKTLKCALCGAMFRAKCVQFTQKCALVVRCYEAAER